MCVLMLTVFVVTLHLGF